MARQQQIENTDALESTLDWVWNKHPKSQSCFAYWLLNDQQAVFWIQGKPGSGKSTLMNYIDKASRSWHVHARSVSQWSTIRFFFDFRANNGLSNNLEGLLRSLLLQVLTLNDSSNDAMLHLEELFGNQTADTWASGILQKVFNQTLLQISTNLCILVDGLDEFSGSMLELLTFFHNLPSTTATKHLIKICFASRPHPVISMKLGRSPGIQMQVHNTLAIKHYAFETMDTFAVAGHDRPRLKDISSDIAKKAEGVFLWARFAVTEFINGYAEGASMVELSQRLEELPSDMNQLYAKILGRLSSRDHEEAKMMFQLVCFEVSDSYHQGVSLRQLKEAVAILQNSIPGLTRGDSPDELERFRNRLRAKSGGLLEEIFHGSNSPRDQKRSKRNGGIIKLIHRTVKSYLDRQGWLLGQSMSPHAMWLHVCCACIQENLEPYESQPQHGKARVLIIDESDESALFEYASENLFVHARELEYRYHESSFPFLAKVSTKVWRCLEEEYREYSPFQNYGPDGRLQLNWNAVKKRCDEQPWQIIVEQGLPLCLRDIISRRYYTPLSHGEDISIAILHVGRFWKFRALENEPSTILLLLCSILIESGVVFRPQHILECVYEEQLDVLRTFLASWPQGKIQLRRDTLWLSKTLLDLGTSDTKEDHTYNGDTVGILWELCRASVYSFDNDMLDFLLERGESLDEVCGPGGTALHACIIGGYLRSSAGNAVISTLSIEQLLTRGANPNVSGPRGTPLQLAWRMSRAPYDKRKSCVVFQLQYFQSIMQLLLRHGAEASWTEPNGTVVDRATIEAWCALSFTQLETERGESYYPYCISNWYTYEYPLYVSHKPIRVA